MITTIITYAKALLEIIAYIVVSCLGILGVTSLFKFKEKNMKQHSIIYRNCKQG